ncbi:MAG TPA: FAD-dependent oxidoreductase, partial [Gemmatimonadaceae bacterium]|nr:FAD-dependent oxidoreductase [Gemmatimonadaceae bacterium]
AGREFQREVAVSAHRQAADVLVVGGGIVGLSCAVALLERGVRVTVCSDHRRGEASPAAAGMLAPGVERARDGAARFSEAARDRYPAFLAALEEASGIRVPLLRNGILQVALTEPQGDALRADLPEGARWLDRGELAALETALAGAVGACFHPHDGAVDNVMLVEALERRVERDPRAALVRGAVREILPRAPRPAARLAGGELLEGDAIVLAAGAWAGAIRGVPRALPVAPVRGQMLALDAVPLRHVTYGPGGYVVPRGGATIAGSTMENVGFEVGTTDAGMRAIERTVATICPPLAHAPRRASWSGLRPVTPDLHPIIGADPECPTLFYACGHSRNGILLAPLTGDCIAALVTGAEPPQDVRPFAVTRFAGSAASDPG